MPAANDVRLRPDKALTYAALVIMAGVLATTLAQTQVLARLPLQNLLKNELHADRTANAAFFFWAGLAWYLKPFAGILTDAFPLFGNRRKSYILISAVLAGLSWLALIVTPHEYRNLLFVAIVINASHGDWPGQLVYSVMLMVSLDRDLGSSRLLSCSTVPQNLTSGRHSERLTPKSLILEVIGLGRMGPIFMAASCSQDVMRPIHQDPTRGSPRGCCDDRSNYARSAAFSMAPSGTSPWVT